MCYIRNLAKKIFKNVNKIIKSKFIKKVIYLFRSSKKLKNYQKRYLIYIKNKKNLFLKKKL